jgi:hypothetical protein
VFQQWNFSLKLFNKSIQLNLPIILFLVIIIIDLFLSNLPLTNTLGYEFSAVNGILLFILGGFGTIYYQKKIYRNSFYIFCSENKYFILLSIFIPLLIGFISSRINSHCPIAEGFLFFIVITIPSFFFGIITGNLCLGISKKVPSILFVFIFIIIVLSPLIEFFQNPQVYFYNPVFGFSPGTIYDEDLTVDRILVAYRLFNIAFFIIVYFLSYNLREKKRIIKVAIIALIFFTASLFSYLKPELLFATDQARLEKNLSAKIVTDHFNIYKPSKNENTFNYKYIALLHEYSLEQIEDQLNAKFSYKINSYLFESGNQKRELFGAGNADVAKPWLEQVYLNLNDFNIAVKHEIAHDVGGMFTDIVFKIPSNFNPALIEGFATAVDNNYDGYPVHYMAKLAELSGYKFPVEPLFSGFSFFSKASAISYICAGSFMKFLEDTYGAGKFKLVYKDGDFEKIYGMPLNELALKYNDFISNYPINFNKYRAQLYFGGTTIFKKFCPRMAASEVKKAREKYQDNKIDDALELFNKVYNYSGSFQSLSGIVACLSKQKKYSKCEQFLKDQIVYFIKSPNYFNMELWLGDLYIENGKLASATAVYDSIISQNPHIGYANEASVRKLLINKGIDTLINYLHGNAPEKLAILINLNKNNNEYCSIPILINLSKQTNIKIDEFLTRLQKNIKITDYLSSYVSLQLSKYYLEKLEYEKAKFFAVRSLDFNMDDNEKYKFVENLRMVNWFTNFAGRYNIRIENTK